MKRSLLAFLAVACGSAGPSGSATVNGAVDGAPVVTGDVIGLVGNELYDGVPSAYAGIVIASTTGTCARAVQDSVWNAPPGSAVFVLDVVVPCDSVTPGTYPVGGSGIAQYTAVDASGSSNSFAGSGTVTFTSVGDALTGTFDVNLATQGHFTGDFTAPVCAGGKSPF